MWTPRNSRRLILAGRSRIRAVGRGAAEATKASGSRRACRRVVALTSGVLIAAGSAFAAPGDTNRISSGGSGQHSSLSNDGRFIAFELYAPAINTTDVFVVERATGTIEKVSVGVGGTQADNNSYEPSISADGRYVSFTSYASNLVAGDTNFAQDVFVRDRQNGTTERVSVATGGGQADQFGAGQSSVSGDGNRIAFQSESANLVPGDTNGLPDVFVRDRQAGTTQRVGVGTGGAQGTFGASEPSISADGRFVAFSSSSTNLVPGDTNSANDIFVRDLQASTTERVSVSSSGVEASVDSFATGDPCCGRRMISADGRFVAFQTASGNLVAGDDNNTADVFVRDRQTNETSRVNVSSTGEQADGPSVFGAISADGRHVVFSSLSSNLISPPDTNVLFDAFVHDRQTGVTTRVSVATGGGQGNGISVANSISGDGRYVSFESDASNLVSGDTTVRDVFIHERDVGPSSFTLTVERSGTGAGSVASDPAGISCGADCSEDFVENSVVTLVAEAAPGSTFAGWSGGGCAGTGDCTVTVDRAVTVAAEFTGAPPPPDTIITTGASATNAGVAFFVFVAEPPVGATFECSLDGEPFAACTAPYTSPILDPGAHTFDVRASNANGTDATPATRSFTVDRVAPTTAITLAGDRTPLGAYAGSVTVDADATDPVPSSGIRNKFCLVDPPTPPTSFASFASQPCGFAVTAIGTHTAYAVSNDEAGNESAVVSETFLIAAAPDTIITSGPSGDIYSLPVKWSYRTTVAGSTFECRMDTGAWEPCPASQSYLALDDGPHTFSVRAVGPTGVVDPTPDTRTITLGSRRTNGSCSGDVPFGEPARYDKPFSLGGVECVALDDFCPAGSRCTITLTAGVTDADVATPWASSGNVKLRGAPNGAATRCYSTPQELYDSLRDPNTPPVLPCAQEKTYEFVGPAAVKADCVVERNYFGSGYNVRGPDNLRRHTCAATLDVRPVRIFDLTVTGKTGATTVPGPGQLAITGSLVGVQSVTAPGTASVRAATVPASALKLKKRVKAQGVVRFPLGLKGEAKRLYDAGGAIDLDLTTTFTAADGTITTTQQEITLQRTVKPPRIRTPGGSARCRVFPDSCP